MNELDLTARLLGLATLLQAVELIQLKATWVDDGLWSWQVLREDEESFPRKLLPFLDRLLSERGFEVLLWVRIVFGLALGFGSNSAVAAIGALLGTWLCSIRWRGTFNGGSDSMTAQIAGALVVARTFPFHTFIYFALAFIAVQITASYTVAGFAKFRNPEWRTGTILVKLFTLPGYDAPPGWLRNLLSKPDTARKLSLGIMGFECFFPLSWLHPSLCTLFIAGAVIFHLVCYQVLGLNRFVFAWLAGYPALYGIVSSFYGK